MKFNLETNGCCVEDALLIMCFLAVIFSPSLFMAFGIAPSFDLGENRELAKMPSLQDVNYSIGGYLNGSEDYFNDNFGFRSHLIRANGMLHVGVLGISPNEKVIIGKNDFLFLRDTMLDPWYRPIKPFDEKELLLIKNNLEKLECMLSSRGVRLIILIIPPSNYVYPEYLPDEINSSFGKTMTDQLIEYLRINSKIRTIDVRPALLEAKKDNLVFFRNDVHPNYFAAYSFADSISKNLSGFYSLNLAPLSEYNVSKGLKNDNLARLMSLEYMLPEEGAVAPKNGFHINEKPTLWYNTRENISRLYTTELNDSSKLKAIVSGDSAIFYLMPFLSPNFRQVIYLDPVNDGLQQEIVEYEKPDIVFFEIFESNLRRWKKIQT